MLRTNISNLVKMAVIGKPIHPYDNMDFNNMGTRAVQMFCEGITYNVRIGAPAFGWIGDHIEPAVTINHENEKVQMALVTLSCIGNVATIMTGKAAGETGIVTGKHGGGWNVICDFSESVMDKITYDDEIQVRAYGQGLQLLDYPDIIVHNIDPTLLAKMDIQEKNGKLIIPVANKIPAYLAGSGIGGTETWGGDIDIMTSDMGLIKQLGLDTLRYGDFVFMEDVDHTFNHTRRKGACSIGIIIHGDSYKGGHGPGITPILTCKKDLIEYRIDPAANIIKYIGMK